MKMVIHDSLYLYSTREAYSIIPVNSSAKGLFVDRLNYSVTLRSQSNTFKSISPKRIFGIVGIISLKLDQYIIVITQRSHVGTFNGHNIFQATGFEILPVRLTRSIISGDTDEKEYIKLLKVALNLSRLYYSPSLDLTTSMQSQAKKSVDYSWQSAEEKFYWNYFLCQELIQKIGSDKDSMGFIIPMISGFVDIQEFYVNGSDLTLALISRRSRHYAGTRYFTRGLDANGNAANCNETEQAVIVSYKDQSLSERRDLFSFLQLRGSIPIKWFELITMQYSPSLIISRDREGKSAIVKHFDDLFARYGRVKLINLIRNKGREAEIKQAFERALAELDDERLSYAYFDFTAECKNMRFERIEYLISKISSDLTSAGYFHASILGEKTVVESQQSAVMRTNCMDCLDRTGVTQSYLGRYVLESQLRSKGILAPGQEIRNIPSLEIGFRTLWADNGDAVSKAYAGSCAQKGDFTRTGFRTKYGILKDLTISIQRYLRNNYYDGINQDAFDLLMGVYLVRSRASIFSPFSETRNLQLQIAPYVIYISVFMLCAQAILPAKRAYLPARVFSFFWLSALIGSIFYIYAHAYFYLSWPRLVPRDYGLELSSLYTIPINSKGQKLKSLEDGDSKRLD